MFVKDNQYPTLSVLWTHNAVILESSTILTDGFVQGNSVSSTPLPPM